MCCVWAAIQTARESVWLLPLKSRKPPLRLRDTEKAVPRRQRLGSVSVWYAEDGIHLSHGKSVRYDRSAQVISWESAAERIGELLESGQFASNVELAEAAGYERSLLAEKLWHLYHDFSDKARDSGYLSCLSGIQRTGFPEETAWLAEQLSDPLSARPSRKNTPPSGLPISRTVTCCAFITIGQGKFGRT